MREGGGIFPPAVHAVPAPFFNRTLTENFQADFDCDFFTKVQQESVKWREALMHGSGPE
jgi:hypothetical protein